MMTTNPQPTRRTGKHDRVALLLSTLFNEISLLKAGGARKPLAEVLAEAPPPTEGTVAT